MEVIEKPKVSFPKVSYLPQQTPPQGISTGRRVFVTGGRGFLGNNLVHDLISKGIPTVCLVRDDGPWAIPVSGVDIVWGDITDWQLLLRILIDYQVETVFHLAAQSIVTKALQWPISTFETNTMGTTSVLEACRVYGSIKSVVVMSSDKALGRQDTLPYTEDMVPNPVYPYDASKTCAEIIARSYALTYDLPIVIARSANIYGPGDLNASRIIPDTIRSILDEKSPVIRSDGKAVRDYVYVADVVRGLEMLADAASRFKGQIFHFGTGQGVSVLSLVEKILFLMQSNLKPEILGTARNELDEQYVSATKAQCELQWTPEIPLDQGIAETVAWWRLNIAAV